MKATVDAGIRRLCSFIGMGLVASIRTEMGYQEGHVKTPRVSILDKLTLLAWLACLLLTIVLVYDSRWNQAVSLGFPFFLALALWTIHLSFETKAAAEKKGWLYIVFVVVSGLAFSVIWFLHLYHAFLE